MNYTIGYTDKYQFTIKKGGALYDPTVVQVSFVKGDGSEDTLTCGGLNPRDGQLTKISEGVYQWWYRYDVLGEWRVCERWSDQGGAAEVRPSSELRFTIDADPHTWTDVTPP